MDSKVAVLRTLPRHFCQNAGFLSAQGPENWKKADIFKELLFPEMLRSGQRIQFCLIC